MFLTEVDEDGTAFSQFEVGIGEEGNLAEGIDVEILLGTGLIAHQVDLL